MYKLYLCLNSKISQVQMAGVHSHSNSPFQKQLAQRTCLQVSVQNCYNHWTSQESSCNHEIHLFPDYPQWGQLKVKMVEWSPEQQMLRWTHPMTVLANYTGSEQHEAILGHVSPPNKSSPYRPSRHFAEPNEQWSRKIQWRLSTMVKTTTSTIKIRYRRQNLLICIVLKIYNFTTDRVQNVLHFNTVKCAILL